MSNKMFVMGSYGCGNRGDDAILQSICELFCDWEICATNGTYEKVSAYLPVRTVSCRLNEGFSLKILGSMILDSFKILREIAGADLLMFGGGSLIHDLTPYNLPFLFFWHFWAKLLRKKVCYFSMGVGPLKASFGKKLARFFLKRADGLFVRDNRGLEICRSLGLENAVLTADAAFAVRQKNQCGQQTLRDIGVLTGEYFCVTGSQWFESSNFWKREKMDFSRQTQEMAEMIRAAAAELKKTAVFVPTVMHDLALAENLKHLLPEIDFRIAPANWNCKQMAEILENASMLIGVRMHSIILSARQGVPYVALIYDEKVQQLLIRLDGQDLALPLEDASPAQVVEKIRSWDSLKTERLLQRVEELRESVERSAGSVRVWNWR